MNKYPKIETAFKRNPDTNYKTVLDEWANETFECLQCARWNLFEKVDGSNIRTIYDPINDELKFRGRTDKAQLQPELYEYLSSTFKKETFREKFDNDEVVCLYGEGYGRGIQKGGGNYIQDGVGFILFDVMVGSTWLEYKNTLDIANFFNIQHVPLIHTSNLWEAANLVSKGIKSKVAQSDIYAEGVVAKPTIGLFDRKGNRIITKMKTMDFRDE